MVLISVAAVVVYRVIVSVDYCGTMTTVQCLVSTTIISALLNAVSILLLGRVSILHGLYDYTPGIYADGYIVFAFRFVRSHVVSLFVRNSGTFVEFRSEFWLKFL